ncbi:Cyclin-dependent kinase regulatory subunit [Ancylostoma caninum]|uniref:Cyclin-dependent kinases regulatory subunit n=1 Tax=Ancylostoma caninum TaxID=29170 RepID=A0A368FKQ1_ANCCA|nr:Cyclin-dependent kinase regulatory subunit [Ancylostoma caninum]
MDHSIRLWYLGTDKLQERIRDSMTLKGQANFRKELADDCQSGRTIQIHYPIAINTDLHNDYVDCVRFLGHYVVSKGSDMSVVVFRFGSFGEEFYKIRPKLQVDTSALQLVRMDLPDSDIWFIKFDIDPLNRWIVSGNKMGQLCFWDLTEGLPGVNMNVTVKIAECCIRQICFGANGRIMVAVADDYSVTRLERILEGEDIPPYCKSAGLSSVNGPSAKRAKRRSRKQGRKRNSDSGSSENILAVQQVHRPRFTINIFRRMVFSGTLPCSALPPILKFSFEAMTTGSNDFYYSNKYEDDEYEYRHVHVTKEVAKLIPKNRLMSETEWRSLGIQQSPGWVHYMIHGPERHVLLFRRPLPNKQNIAGKPTGQAQVGVR